MICSRSFFHMYFMINWEVDSEFSNILSPNYVRCPNGKVDFVCVVVLFVYARWLCQNMESLPPRFPFPFMWKKITPLRMLFLFSASEFVIFLKGVSICWLKLALISQHPFRSSSIWCGIQSRISSRKSRFEQFTFARPISKSRFDFKSENKLHRPYCFLNHLLYFRT